MSMGAQVLSLWKKATSNESLRNAGSKHICDDSFMLWRQRQKKLVSWNRLINVYDEIWRLILAPISVSGVKVSTHLKSIW